MLKNLMLMAGLLILIAVMGFNNALKNNNSNSSYILKNLTNNDIPNISDISV